MNGKQLAILANWWLGGWIVLFITSALGATFPNWMTIITSPIPLGQQLHYWVNPNDF